MDTTISKKLHKSSVHNKVDYVPECYLYDTKNTEAVESTSVYIDCSFITWSQLIEIAYLNPSILEILQESKDVWD